MWYRMRVKRSTIYYCIAVLLFPTTRMVRARRFLHQYTKTPYSNASIEFVCASCLDRGFRVQWNGRITNKRSHTHRRTNERRFDRTDKKQIQLPSDDLMAARQRWHGNANRRSLNLLCLLYKCTYSINCMHNSSLKLSNNLERFQCVL